MVSLCFSDTVWYLTLRYICVFFLYQIWHKSKFTNEALSESLSEDLDLNKCYMYPYIHNCLIMFVYKHQTWPDNSPDQGILKWLDTHLWGPVFIKVRGPKEDNLNIILVHYTGIKYPLIWCHLMVHIPPFLQKKCGIWLL